MPNRILRDWTDSETVDILSVQAERFFTRLIMKVDDFGRYYANVKLLKSNLFPLKTDVRETDITRWLAECEKSGLIALYSVSSKEYLQINNFKQTLRQKTEKFPSPEMSSNCIADDTQTHSNCDPETKRSRNRKETESEVETEPPQAASADPPPKFVLQNPFSEKFLDQWSIWKNYKKKEWKFLFKSVESEQASLNDLVEKSGGNEEIAVKIINQSLANGWKGLFELKNENHESTSGKTSGKPGSKVNGSELNTALAKFRNQKQPAGNT